MVLEVFRMKKKLVFVVNEYSFFMSHRVHLAREARRQGYDVFLISGGHIPELPEDREFETYFLNLSRRGMSLFSELRMILRLFQIYRELRPDLVHLLTIKPVVYGGIAARIARVPAVVFAITGLGYVFTAQGFKSRILRRIVSLLYRLAFTHKNFKVIFQNPDDRDYLLKEGLLSVKNCKLIRGSGVDPEEYPLLPFEGGVPLVVFASRLLRDKGVYEFVEAARMLKEKHVCARFAIVGAPDDGNPTSVSKKDLDLWRAKNWVEIWGHSTDMVSVFQKAQVVCLPSYREGVPRVLIEAASCGRPVVATDAPGCREIVKDNVNGILVPIKDSKSLALGLEKLIQSEALCREMGKRGRERVMSEFSLGLVIQSTLEVYRELAL